jgi:UDP-glucose 4-epimerase
MRYLITGGAGFIGSHLADLLVARGDTVTILDDLSTGRRENVAHLLETDSAELVPESVLDVALVDELMSRSDVCFHLASSVGVKLIVDNPLDSILSMVRGTDVVMAAAARYRTRLVFTSTSEIYGKNGGQALDEDSDRLVGPTSKSRWSYATAKAFGETLAFGYTREHGARMTVARLFNTVGPRQSAAYGMVLPRFVRQAIAGADITVYGDGSQSRCFTHVHDSADALVRLSESRGTIGHAYNIGTAEPIRILDLARLVRERADSSSRIRLVPYEEAYGTGFEELGRRRPDCNRLEQATGWRPRFTVRDAIDDVVAFERRTNRAVADGYPQVTGRFRRHDSEWEADADEAEAREARSA